MRTCSFLSSALALPAQWPGVSWQTCSPSPPHQVTDARTLPSALHPSWNTGFISPCLSAWGLHASACPFRLGITCAFTAKRDMAKGSQKEKL